MDTTRITKIREMLLLSLFDVFQNRCDFTFFSPSSKENKVHILDETSEDLSQVNVYPRVVLFRVSSSFRYMSGINDNLSGHESVSMDFSRTDLFVHNLTFRVVAQNATVCENLAYVVTIFLRFLSQEIIKAFVEEQRDSFEIFGVGMSPLNKVDPPQAVQSLYQCDVSFSVSDQEIININRSNSANNINGVEFVLNLPNLGSC